MAGQRNLDLGMALAEAEKRFIEAHPKSGRRHDDARKVMPGGNTRTVIYYPPFPVTIARGEGCFVWDLDGNRYTDFVAEYTAGLYGHSEPAIVAAVQEALADGIVLGAPNRYEAELARLIVERFPALDLVRFTNSGTEANLMAISVARVFTGRAKVMVMQGGYHGGVFIFSGQGSPLNAPFPFLVAQYNDLEGARAMIRANAADLACVILEPMLGGGGCIPADTEFLRMLRDETRAAGSLLIFDEVMTSRLSPAGQLGIEPDLKTLGKYVGGGMSFGAFGGRREIMALFDPTSPNALPHAGTFNNNTLTMKVGSTAMSEIYTPEACTDLNARGDALREALNDLFMRYQVRMKAMGQGSMIAIHPMAGEIKSPHDIEKTDKRLRQLLFLDLLEQGVYIAERGFMALSLMVTDADCERVLAAVEKHISQRRAPTPTPPHKGEGNQERPCLAKFPSPLWGGVGVGVAPNPQPFKPFATSTAK